LWGNAPGHVFFSGRGSHENTIVDSYVAAIQKFFSTLPIKPSVLDLGCGDFNIGSKLRSMCSTFIACDIVAELIEHNKLKYGHLNVEFVTADITDYHPQNVDVIFARQIFQHLSNDQIVKCVKNIVTRCQYLIVTEHLPNGNFIPNHDKPTGANIRLDYQSGVILTAPPFNLQPNSAIELCVVPVDSGLIKTTAYNWSMRSAGNPFAQYCGCLRT
jgi:SAM-dependent methyltransferase